MTTPDQPELWTRHPGSSFTELPPGVVWEIRQLYNEPGVLVRVPFDEAVERMVEVDLEVFQKEADGDPSFIFDDGLPDRLRVRNGLRLRAALGEKP